MGYVGDWWVERTCVCVFYICFYRRQDWLMKMFGGRAYVVFMKIGRISESA